MIYTLGANLNWSALHNIFIILQKRGDSRYMLDDAKRDVIKKVRDCLITHWKAQDLSHKKEELVLKEVKKVIESAESLRSSKKSNFWNLPWIANKRMLFDR